MREQKTRVGEIRTLRGGRKPRTREEVKCFAKICSSTSNWSELWGNERKAKEEGADTRAGIEGKVME